MVARAKNSQGLSPLSRFSWVVHFLTSSLAAAWSVAYRPLVFVYSQVLCMDLLYQDTQAII
jgi:hypothetical protein